MISAFGVEHTISKGFKKLEPKLTRAFERQPWGPGLQERMRANYLAGRLSGGRGNKEHREIARASAKAVNNMNRRKKRVLP